MLGLLVHLCLSLSLSMEMPYPYLSICIYYTAQLRGKSDRVRQVELFVWCCNADVSPRERVCWLGDWYSQKENASFPVIIGYKFSQHFLGKYHCLFWKFYLKVLIKTCYPKSFILIPFLITWLFSILKVCILILYHKEIDFFESFVSHFIFWFCIFWNILSLFWKFYLYFERVCLLFIFWLGSHCLF